MTERSRTFAEWSVRCVSRTRNRAKAQGFRPQLRAAKISSPVNRRISGGIRSGISDGFSQCLLSLCYNSAAISSRLPSNVTLYEQACHKPLADPFLVCALHKLVRFCSVPRHFAIYCEIPLHSAKLRLRAISQLAVK